ncbi:MAG: hypothetical protein J0M26_11925 [Planctomycetes bacterium]|nr:hypothetical protein [Planctomycetota bacterium]
MMSTEGPKQIPANIVKRLDEVRRGIRTYIAWETAFWITIWLLSLFWLVTAADYLPIRAGSTEMPQPIRAIALSIIAIGILILLYRVGLSRYFVKVSDSSAANLLERQFPQLSGKVTTAIELANKPPPPETNPELYHALVTKVTDEADSLITPLKIQEVFDWKPLILKGLLTSFLVIGTAATAVQNTSWFVLAVKRLFALSSETWPRQSRLYADGIQLVIPGFSGETTTRRQPLVFTDSTVAVPRGSSGVLRIVADTTAPVVPDLCTLLYRMPDGQRGQAALKGVNGGPENGQLFILDGPPFESMVDSMTLDVYGGDFRLREQQIIVVDPAVITSMQVECIYPAYLYEKETGRWGIEKLDYRYGMQVPEGTHCVLIGKSESELSYVEYTIRTSADVTNTTPTILKLPCSGKEFQLPLQPWKGNAVVECLAFDKAGLPSAQVQRYQLSSVPDALPSVNTRLAGIGTEITTKAYLPLKGKITDDHQVASSQLEFGAAETGTVKVPVPIAADGSVDFVLDLQQLTDDGKLTLPLNSTVGLSVTATDLYDLDGAPHIGLGEAIQLTVVTPEQLILSLEKRELALRGRLEQILFELTEMQALLGKIEKSPWNSDKLVDAEGLDTEEEETSAADSASNSPDEQAKKLAAARRRQTLFVQQASVQTDKSFDEVNGILASVLQIRDELIHNRVDSTDRRERLEIRIAAPLKTNLDGNFAKLQQTMKGLNRLPANAAEGPAQTSETIQLNNLVINDLNAILENMLDIESYNEIVDMVRNMLEQQEKILERTKSEQKRKVKDLFGP